MLLFWRKLYFSVQFAGFKILHFYTIFISVRNTFRMIEFQNFLISLEFLLKKYFDIQCFKACKNRFKIFSLFLLVFVKIMILNENFCFLKSQLSSFKDEIACLSNFRNNLSYFQIKYFIIINAKFLPCFKIESLDINQYKEAIESINSS